MEELNLIIKAIEVTKKVTGKNFTLHYFEVNQNDISLIYNFILRRENMFLDFGISQVRNYEKKLWLLNTNNFADSLVESFKKEGIKA